MEELIPTQQIAKEKQYRYIISMGVYLPFELYLNDILIKRGATGVSSAVELNPWLLRNETYKVTIKFFPDVGGDTVVNMANEQLPYRLDFYKIITNDKKDIESQDPPINLPLVTTSEDLPYFEQSWDIEVKDLPYELEGWSNGQDLSKWDKDLLLKKVVSQYQKLRTILNDGEANEFNRLCLQRDKETNVFNYDYNSRTTLEEFESNSQRIREYAEGNMVDIENFKLKIYGKNNQLVSLERIDEGNKGEGVLRTLEPDGAIRIYNLKLYLPKDSNEFVIIRK